MFIYRNRYRNEKGQTMGHDYHPTPRDAARAYAEKTWTRTTEALEITPTQAGIIEFLNEHASAADND